MEGNIHSKIDETIDTHTGWPSILIFTLKKPRAETRGFTPPEADKYQETVKPAAKMPDKSPSVLIDSSTRPLASLGMTNDVLVYP